MKKFDLEAAKNGAAVCLRDGTPAKILDFQFHFPEGDMILYKYYDHEIGSDIELIAEQTGTCIKIVIEKENARKYDLCMAPVYAYACIYKDPMTGVLSTNYIHQTYKEANANQLMDREDREFFCHARIEMLFKEEQEAGENE